MNSPAYTVLVAEDNREQLKIRCLLLQQHGWTCLAAPDSSTAVSLAQLERPFCALVDLGLPTLAEGLALVMELQSLTPAPWIIVLTGQSKRGTERRAELATVASVIEKGSPFTQVLSELTRLKEESSMRDRQSRGTP